MEFDFTKLEKISSANPPDCLTGAETITDGYKGLQREVKQEREAEEGATAVYKKYQENIKTSNQLQTEIIKGVKRGESVYNLFLKATKAISLMTSNTLFYDQIEADIKAIYGAGLLELAPLELEHNAVQERLRRLRETLTREGEPEDSRQRIASAIKAHEERAFLLQENIKNSGVCSLTVSAAPNVATMGDEDKRGKP